MWCGVASPSLRSARSNSARLSNRCTVRFTVQCRTAQGEGGLGTSSFRHASQARAVSAVESLGTSVSATIHSHGLVTGSLRCALVVKVLCDDTLSNSLEAARQHHGSMSRSSSRFRGDQTQPPPTGSFFKRPYSQQFSATQR